MRTYEQSNEDRLLAVAGRAVFYGLLALFPAITAMVSFYGLFAKPSTISDHLAIAADFLPADVLGFVKDQIARVVAKGDAKLSFAFVSSFLLATWSANGGMKAVLDALNVFYQEKERRGFIRLNIVSFAFTFSGLIAVLGSPLVLLSLCRLCCLRSASAEPAKWCFGLGDGQYLLQ